MMSVLSAQSLGSSEEEVMVAPPCNFNLRLADFPSLGDRAGKFGNGDSSDTDSFRDASTAVSTTDSARTPLDSEAPDAQPLQLPITAKNGKRRQRQGGGGQPLPGHIQDMGYQPVVDLGTDEISQMASEEVARYSARLSHVAAELLDCDSAFERNRCIKRAMRDYETAIKWVQTISPVTDDSRFDHHNLGAHAHDSVAPSPMRAASVTSACCSPVAHGDAIGASILAMVQSPKTASIHGLPTHPPPLPPMSGLQPAARDDLPPPPPMSPPRFFQEGSPPYHQLAGFAASSPSCNNGNPWPSHGRGSQCGPVQNMQSAPLVQQHAQHASLQSTPAPTNAFAMQGCHGLQAIPQQTQHVQQQVLQSLPPRSQQQHHCMPVSHGPGNGVQQQPQMQQPQQQMGMCREMQLLMQGMPSAQQPQAQHLQQPSGQAGPCSQPAPFMQGFQQSQQHNSQWELPHQSSNRFAIFDPQTGEELQTDASRDRSRFRITNPETGKEVY